MVKKLIIDPGHGGKDPGAVAFGVREKDWTLKISQYQYHRFKELGVNVEMTRHDDITLEPVARISRVKNSADICISNHFNAFNGSVRGVEVIHSIHASPRLSQSVAQKLVEHTDLPLRRVFSRSLPNKKHDYYFMHRLTGSTQTIIIEYGFIDQRDDHAYYLTVENMYAAAEAVIETVCNDMGVLYKAVPHKKLLQSSNGGTAEVQLSNKEFLRPLVQGQSASGKGVRSIHEGKLRFYNKPSWKDIDVFGYMSKGQVFPIVLEKLSVGKGEQYKVRNSKGEVYYVTAHPNYVERIH
ncbi:hypothetical protein GCM10008929_22740 [Alkalibacterium psychrotolerans]